jgi:hypothetical protein
MMNNRVVTWKSFDHLVPVKGWSVCRSSRMAGIAKLVLKWSHIKYLLGVGVRDSVENAMVMIGNWGQSCSSS